MSGAMPSGDAALPIVLVSRTPTPNAGVDDWLASCNLLGGTISGRGPTERDAREHLRTRIEGELWRARARLMQIELILDDRSTLLNPTGVTP